MSLYCALKKSLRLACYGFCVLTLLYSLIMLAANDTYATMSVLVVTLFYPFCFVIVFVNELLRKSRLNILIHALLHYVTTLLAFWLCICFPHRASLTGASGTVLFAAVTIIYAIGTLIVSKYSEDKKKKAEHKAEYKNVYSDMNRK